MDLSAAIWRKSSFSQGDGQNCVEVAVIWRKSSYSSGGGQNCVEVAVVPGAVAIRDSKDPHGPAHVIHPAAFRRLITGIKHSRA
jgi:Domain of unknown function (DUF397)